MAVTISPFCKDRFFTAFEVMIDVIFPTEVSTVTLLRRLSDSILTIVPTRLFRKLLQNDAYRLHFATRFADLLNSVFQPTHMLEQMEAQANAIRTEMPMHIERWAKYADERGSQPTTMEAWEKNLELLRFALKERPKYAWQHLQRLIGLIICPRASR